MFFYEHEFLLFFYVWIYIKTMQILGSCIITKNTCKIHIEKWDN